jgi:glycosyltransferase involved in cell wall biosynthesis
MRPIYSIHLSTAKSWRGGENQVWLLARGLIRHGDRALVIAPRNAPLLERCRDSGIPTADLHVSGELDLFGAVGLARLLRREKPDVLHAHDGHALLPARIASWFAPRHGLYLVAHRRTVFPLKGRWKYQGRVDRIVAISAAVRERLLADGISDPSIRVVFSGLEFPDAAANGAGTELRRKLGLSEDAFVFAHAAALTSEKRQHDMLRALAQVLETLKGSHLANVHLIIAGTGKLAQTLQTDARQMGIEQHVHFLGFVQDLRPVWSASTAALFASEAEGLCTALIEAQGAGLPAVITRAGGMVEIVEQGRTGLTAEIGNIAELAKNLEMLVRDRELCRKMGESAAGNARTKFSAEQMVEGVSRVYRELLGEYGRP